MQKLKKIMVVNYTRVQWRRYHNSWEATQCRQCQRWGHATSQCIAVQTCGRCTKEHMTQDCLISPESPDVNCANCGQGHATRNKSCPLYKAIVARKHARDEQRSEVRYVDAPAPAENAWERRAAANQIQEEAGWTAQTRNVQLQNGQHAEEWSRLRRSTEAEAVQRDPRSGPAEQRAENSKREGFPRHGRMEGGDHPEQANATGICKKL